VVYRDEFLRRLTLVPGVESVSVSTRAPFVSSASLTRVRRYGDTTAPIEVDVTELATANFFDTLRIPLRRGRAFSAEDLGGTGGQPRSSVIISESLAAQLFGTADPIGQSVEFRTISQAGRSYEIVGVVGDARYNSLTEDVPLMVYEPTAPDAVTRGFTFVVRAAPGVDVAGAIRAIANALNPSLPVNLPMSVREGIARTRGEWDVWTNLMTGLAAVAGLLAAIGLYGVVAFGVTARRREFGIRLALGAAPARVMALVVRRTATIAVVGLVLGAGGAYAMARILSHRLFGVTPFDPATWALSAIVFLAITAIASWIPIRRAVSVDVTRSLRSL